MRSMPSALPGSCSRERRVRAHDWGRRRRRALLSTREGASACTAVLNELRALLVSAPPELRERLQRLPEGALLAAYARLRPGRSSERAACALALRSLALRVRALRAEAQALEREGWRTG
jgi:hypothetical protein